MSNSVYFSKKDVRIFPFINDCILLSPSLEYPLKEGRSTSNTNLKTLLNCCDHEVADEMPRVRNLQIVLNQIQESIPLCEPISIIPLDAKSSMKRRGFKVIQGFEQNRMTMKHGKLKTIKKEYYDLLVEYDRKMKEHKKELKTQKEIDLVQLQENMILQEAATTEYPTTDLLLDQSKKIVVTVILILYFLLKIIQDC